MKMMSEWAEWWAELQPGEVVPLLVWNFTAPYHGHGIADSHAGVISQKLTRRQSKGQHGGGPEAVGGGPGTVDEMAEMMSEMKNTKVIVFDKIERPEYRIELRPLHGHIKQYFQFRFCKRPIPLPTITVISSSTSSTIGKEQWEVVVEYRKRSSDKEEVEGDPWMAERFIPTGKQTKKVAKVKRKREDAPEPASLSLSSSSAAIDGVRPRAVAQQAAATGTAPKKQKCDKKPIKKEEEKRPRKAKAKAKPRRRRSQ